MRKIAFIICLIWLAVHVHAQVHVRTYNYDEVIRTVRVLRADNIEDGRQLAPERPFLILYGETIDGSEPANTLHISFDQMSHNVHTYTYTVVHMNAERTKESDLLSSEYLSGFTTADITDYEHSINTTREYTHYWFTFPNADMQLTKSGNYLLTVYEDGDRDKKVVEVDFCVVEQRVSVHAQVRTTTDIEFNGRYQQMDLDIQMTAVDMKNANEFKVLVRENNRTDNEVWLTRPTYVEPKKLRYVNCRDLIFEGTNEYHHFDAFSPYYAGTGIDRVFFENGDYHVMLFPDEISQGTYIHQDDSNGQFIINAERTQSPDVEGEYMWVHWVVPTDKPWFDGALYIGGDIFNNDLQLTNRMEYDPEAKCYWLTALVKQGAYDYQYWFRSKGVKKTTTQRVDGSYWQTRNAFSIYVYWRPFGARYDRLLSINP
ncbi:MAG: DUF5103 domain-containing protein [Paludibacteraceae bacterium]|nr:DUF5103 domain-containing protein [Paludibacteraceae bacterium]